MTISPVDLIGAWQLLSAEEVLEDGTRRPEFGTNPIGYLCYSADGIVSAVLGDTDRPLSHRADPQQLDQLQAARMSQRFIAYAGPFTVNPGNDTITHYVDVALFTDWQGHPQERHVHLDGNDLFITGSPRVGSDGVAFHTELHWTRASPAHRDTEL